MMTIAEALGEIKEKFLSAALNRGVFVVIVGYTMFSPTPMLADYVDANNEGYQSLDYIVATGSQWIVTDIRPSCTDTVKMKFRLSATERQALYCSRTTHYQNTFSAFFYENVVRSDRNEDFHAKGNTHPSLIDDTTLVSDYGTRMFSVNGIEQGVLMGEGDFTPGSVLMLFASHEQGENLSIDIASANVVNRGRYRLYYFELYASGSEIPKHSLMPVRRKSDSVAGLYDTVERKFYGPASNSGDFAPSPSITDVTAQQRYPWNGKVDISYTVTGDIAATVNETGTLPALVVTATDRADCATYTATSVAVSGDTELTEGRHSFIWDMSADGLTFKSTNVVFTVAISCAKIPTYLVIDLSSGAEAENYPVSYMYAPPSGGFNTDEYKTTKLVLRHIAPGTIPTRNVNLTKPYYIGIFEVTQKQYELVMGTRPSYFSNVSCYETRPVERVSYNMIRGSSSGAGWPGSSAVDATSFMGKLRAKTGIDEFDLPTEAQWEYACRAGTTTDFNNGKNLTGNANDANLNEVGRYLYNGGQDDSQECTTSGGTAKVGSYMPNAWGLYDMHGNVLEWCLDLCNEGGSYRVLRGGGWHRQAAACSSAFRPGQSPSSVNSNYGFRIVSAKSNAESEQSSAVLRSGESGTVTIDLTSGIRLVETSERIGYSSAWSVAEGAAADAVAVVEVNGETVISASGSGFVNWMPQSNGVYVLTHKVVSNGVQIGEALTATFERKTPVSVTLDIGGGKIVAVPQAWLDEYPAIVAAAGENNGAALLTTSANGRKVWECYVLGLDPTLATNDFRIVSIELVDGKPKVEWEPKTNRWTGAEIQAVLKGAERLEGPWADVPEGGEAGFRFFKVVVELP